MKLGLISLHNDAERFPPMGLVSIASYLEDKIGFKGTRIYDANFEDVYEKVIEEKPDVIGISAMTVEYGKAIRFAEKIKKVLNVPIIVGGVHISTLPSSLNEVFDLGVIGEGEETARELISIYFKKGNFGDLKKIRGIAYFENKKLKINEKRELIANLDDIPIPNYNYISERYFEKKEIPSIQEVGIIGYLGGSRSCPYKCVFCSTTHFWGKLRLNSPEYVVKNLKMLIDRYNVDTVKVYDDLFTVSKDRVKSLIEGMRKEGILGKVAFECQPRANLIDDEMCALMKELGIRVANFGFESGSERILGWLKGNSVTVEMNKQAIVLCKKHGIKVYGSLMMGIPNEKIEDMDKTAEFIDFARANGANYIWSFIATPFPATEFWGIAKERGKVNEDMDWDLLSHHNLENPLLLDPDVDKEQFIKAVNRIRCKLRKMKLKIIYGFIMKHPFKAAGMVLTEPKHYVGRFIRQVYKQ